MLLPLEARLDSLEHGEPVIAASDLQAMFVDKRFPEGWRNCSKSRADWVKNTAAPLLGGGA